MKELNKLSKKELIQKVEELQGYYYISEVVGK